MARSMIRCIFCFGCLSLAVPAAAAEKWADLRLKILDGLQLWIDAEHQNAARKARQKPELASLQSVDIAFDASGHGRNLIQNGPVARPLFVSGAVHTALRFDGQRQHLMLSGLGLSLKQVRILWPRFLSPIEVIFALFSRSIRPESMTTSAG